MSSSVTFLQNQVSQLDEPVYARMHEHNPGSCTVVYWNDYGFTRSYPDPETGLVPDFIESQPRLYPKLWLPRQSASWRDVMRTLVEIGAPLVVIADLPLKDRVRLSVSLRARGVSVGFRTDKNALSESRKCGPVRMIEQAIVRLTVDGMFPVSSLTAAYYGWPRQRPCTLFPYATDERKWSPGLQVQESMRAALRNRLGIPDDTFVFVSATKFHPRENTSQIIDAFCRLSRLRDDIHLIALGDGPEMTAIRRKVEAAIQGRVSLPGFVPFRELQGFVFAADALLHLPRVGPWEVSPQDALVAGLGVVATETVGSAQHFVRGDLRRFLVAVGDAEAASQRMNELATAGRQATRAMFEPARALTAEFTVEATARRLLGLVRGLGPHSSSVRSL